MSNSAPAPTSAPTSAPASAAVSTASPSPAPAPTRALAPTGTLVEALWHTGGEASAIEGWEILDYDPDRSSRGRWAGRIIVALLLVGAVAGGIWYATSWQDTQVSAAIDETRQAAADLAGTAQDLDAVRTDLADGSIDAPDRLTTALGSLDGRARALFNQASELPTTDPQAVQVRRAALGAAQQALDLESGLGDAVAYGTTLSTLLARPELPVSATGDQLAGVAEDVAGWVTLVRDAVPDLPSHPLLAEHRADLQAFAADLESWQADYLDALRSGEEQQARVALDELDSRIEAVWGGWEEAAAEVATWTDEALGVLSDRLEDLTRAG